MPARRARAASATWWWTPWGCPCGWPCRRPTSRTGTAPGRSWTVCRTTFRACAWSGPTRATGAPSWGDWVKAQGTWQLDIVRRNPDAKGFEVLPKRWIVERTFAWLGRYRRLSKDYERRLDSSETWIHIALSRCMLKRLSMA